MPDSNTPINTALITGAAARIGRTIALSLAEDGWTIAIHYNSSREPAEALAKQINDQTPGNAEIFPCNLSDEGEVSALIPAATKKLGPLTCLINNASVFEEDDIQTMTAASWDLHLSTNLRAPARLTQLFAEQLPESEKGCVINLIDQRVRKLTPQFLSYTLSKTALWTLTQTLAQALGPRIRVNGVGPGPTIQNKRQAPEDFQKQVDATILQRKTEPADIANAVKYLISAEAITGQMLAVDGGQHLVWQTPDVTDVVE